ncbi:MAG: M1 family metallopeptidase [Bacteroidia bacterium]|nr:M1 family metallopeptidase [Bacteroidia bacterium]
MSTINDILYQRGPFSRKDSLRGALTLLRSCYDVLFYDLFVKVNIPEQSISGSNTIIYKVITEFERIQIDLFSQLEIDSILYHHQKLLFTREHNAVFIQFPFSQVTGIIDTFTVYYHGKPNVAQNPPWQGGFIWEKDKNGRPWVGVACQGHGASSWWPLKDHLSDEPDNGMRITINVPQSLMCVSNGVLVGQEDYEDGTTSFEWRVHAPINSYNVTLNIGDYVHFSDTLQGVLGILHLDFYVLSYHLEKAKKHFAQVKPLLHCFEKYLGPYPFYEDGYALVETPYWGMEHQGAIAYGNEFKNNNFGFDFIIVHESGHEWFGNHISIGDNADLWVHEAFTTYAEAIYVECVHGKEKALEYLQTQRKKINNQAAIQGPYEVNFDAWPDADMYYKGSWMLHTLRTIIADDALWWRALRKMYDVFRGGNVKGQRVRLWFSQFFNIELSSFFSQYLDFREIPILEYRLQKKANGDYTFSFRFQAQAPNFQMPIDVLLNGEKKRFWATTEWQAQNLSLTSEKDFTIDTENYLILTQKLK